MTGHSPPAASLYRIDRSWLISANGLGIPPVQSSLRRYSHTSLVDQFSIGLIVLAEGIVQDVFLNIWLHKDRLNINLSFKSYLFAITRNLTFNLISKEANNRKLKEEVFYKSQKRYSPIEDKITEADYEIIKNNAIKQLPPKRRIIFEMSRNNGMNHKDISKELNISVSTVKGQMSKALKTIREFLRTHGDVTV